MVKIVILDAGHGLPDPGAVKYGQEYKYALDIVKEIAKRLPSTIKPIFTRTSDRALNDNKNSDLKKRCDISNTNNADLFVSIHLNSGGGTGYETLVYSPNNAAQIIHNEVKQVLSANGVKDRGIKTRPDLYVLKNTKAIALLLEIAFIDNKSDMDLVNNQGYFNSMCQAIADGIIKVLGVNPKAPVTSSSQVVPSKNDYKGTSFETTVEKAKAKNIMLGYNDQRFGVNDPLTRGQFVIVLDRLGLLD